MYMGITATRSRAENIHAAIALAIVAVVIGAIAALPVVAADTTAAELTQALQKKYSAIKGFSADFVHSYQGGVLNKQLSERGHLLIKKPGKMRWEYTDPEKKLFVSDG